MFSIEIRKKFDQIPAGMLKFVQLEAIISAIIDEYPRLRPHKSLFTFASCLLMFMGSIVFVTQVEITLGEPFFTFFVSSH